jgi:hypothetical protein
VSGEKQQWRLKQESSIGYQGHWNKYSLVVHGLIETPAGVECDGEYLEWFWTAEKSILSLLVPQGFESIIIHV